VDNPNALAKNVSFISTFISLLDANESSLFDFRFLEVEKRSLKMEMCIRVKTFSLNEN